MPKILCNSREIAVAEGTTLAAALLSAGIAQFRASTTGAARGPVCGMGVCMECRVTVDGERHVLACQTLCRDGMEVETT